MGTSLQNTKIKDTYEGLIKTTDNSTVGSSDKELTDGAGNDLNISVNNTGAITADGNISAAALVKTGGTALQILLADGTIITLTREADAIGSNDSDTKVPSNAAVKDYVDTQITNLIDGSPTALDTLNELAAALGDDASFSTTITTALGKRLRFDASQSLSSGEITQALTNLGISATVAEINYIDGVTSNIQTQLNGLQTQITGGAVTITDTDLAANRALVSTSGGKVSVSNVTSTEIDHLDGVTSAIQTQLNSKVETLGDLSITASSAEINKLDGVTATTAEINHTDGVTSNIQTQIDSKQNTITGAATTIDDSDLTASRAVVSDGSGKVAVSDVTSTEVGHLDGVSSNIQTQINGLQSQITGGATTVTDSNLTADRALFSDSSGKIAVSDITSTELGHLDGVTSGIQTQIDSKQDTITGAATTIDDTNLATERALISNSSGKVAVSAVTSTEVSYLDGVTGSVQNQIDSKQNIAEPHSATAISYTVTVATKTAAHRENGNGSSNGYLIDSVEAPYLNLTVGKTYKFDQSDASNSGHPLGFYYEADKTTAFTSGVTTSGTAGSSGAYVQIVATETTPTVLYYQCGNHALMGNTVNFDTRNLTGFDTADLTEGTNLYYTNARADARIAAATTDDLSEGSSNLYFTNARADGRISAASIDDLSDVDTTTSAPSSGQVLKWDGSNFVPQNDVSGDSAPNCFSTFAVSGQSNIAADSSSDTLTIAAGNNITLSTNASTDTLTINSTAVAGADISWQSSIKTADFTATAGEGYFVDASSASITVTAPSSPSLGDTVNIIDYAGNSATNAIVITSSNKILGADGDRQISTNFGSVQLLYSDATYGWQLTYGNKASTAEGPILGRALVVGGGGGGGYGRTGSGSSQNRGGGGGGAGEFLDKNNIKLQTGKAYKIIVGAGGAADTAGSNSQFKSNADQSGDFVFDFEVFGGGRGAGVNSASNNGGGAGRARTSGGTASGNETSEGSLINDGGDGSADGTTNTQAGGGGGAGAAGQDGNHSGNNHGGDGGDGFQSDITGTNTYYAGGGGGGINAPSGLTTTQLEVYRGQGGQGGGGRGAYNNFPAYTAFSVYGPADGTDGLGGGGGGARAFSEGGAAGGDGVVILKYPSSVSITIGGSLTATTDSSSVSGFKITTFTAGTDDISFTT